MSLHYLVKDKIRVLCKWQWNAPNAFIRNEMYEAYTRPKRTTHNLKILKIEICQQEKAIFR